MGRLKFAALMAVAGVGSAYAASSDDQSYFAFDDRWFVSASGGAALTDSSDFDAGYGLYAAIGKTIAPRLSIEGEIEYLDISVSDVGGSGVSLDFTRFGAGVKAIFDVLQFEQAAVGLTAGASVREIDWLSDSQTGFGGFVGANFRKTLDSNFEFLVDGRYTLDPVDNDGLVEEDTYYTWTLTAGIRYNIGQWPPPAPDSDGDGVPDSADQCPNTPQGVNVNATGCPIDTDGDGVPDYRDRCPNTPEGMLVDEHGCPLDSDGDGVIDPLDKCPDTPRGVAVDAEGCPLDSDQDGVADSKDLCPNTPFGAEVDVNGCPFDTDQDGVPDFRDDCPNTPYGTPVDARGCSNDNDGDGVPNDIDQCPNTFPGLAVDKVGCPLRDQVITLHNVHFEFDKAVLQPDSRTLLERVAKSLIDQPDLQIEVAGHTDSKGSDDYNQRLSDRRAAAVRQYLVSQGVAGENITSKGYGESEPVADNVTEEGRARNRRVEIHLRD
ncbi:ompa/motb domain-containing protein [Oceanococcus atlanticus]|uniref:Ompa/motb domain-containing protein n=1 Tax=Oceanococcus atlanticus TaxID=1317117 RepID=A0A1Y1SGA7_9GAMM|nr:OmpA family protein [Oceanococcus atlanticus]ORE88704.1 ompa/motb domain-containing protein [Oceanococcus atlanticus]